MLKALLVVLAFQRQPVVVDAPVFQSPRWNVAVSRPFDDWVFAPDTAGATATIIFQPRSAHLDDQLWGAVVVTRWGGTVALDSVADRRLRATWRPLLGSAFTVLARDSTLLAGWPCIHLVVTGHIRLAVLDIEEFLVARGNDLVVLQLRYPRGVERDSIARGYRTVIETLDLGQAPGQSSMAPPESCDTSALSSGRVIDPVRAGQFTLRVFRNRAVDSAASRADDSALTRVVRAWRVLWNDFGPLASAQLTLVETAWPATLGCGTTVFLGRDDSAGVLARELSRAWWGGLVPADTSDVPLLEGFAGLSALLVTGDSAWAANGPTAALIESRRLAGGPRFRAAVGTLILESRDHTAAIQAFLAALGESAAAPVRQLLGK